MIIHHDPDEWTTVSTSHTCAFHAEHPGVPFAGCGCSASFSSRKKSPGEIEGMREIREAERRVMVQHCPGCRCGDSP